MSTPATTSRRDFLKTGATIAGGLLVGFSIPARSLAQSAGAAPSGRSARVRLRSRARP